MAHQSDAPVDSDPLLEFAIEPEPSPAEDSASTKFPQAAASMEVAPSPLRNGAPEQSSDELGKRVDRLEQLVERSLRELSSVRAEVATLVASVDDITKRETRAVANSPRPRVAFAVAGVLAGIAIGVSSWTAWSARPIDNSAAGSGPVAAVNLPVEVETPPVAGSIRLASTAPASAATNDLPARAASRISQRQVAYVGTLSIDAAPGGGQVFINRRAAGSTPLRVDNLKAGSHLVWIERAGYRRWTQVVQVRSDRVSRVSASLQPLAAP